jgi:tripartite-type tricarboxylate transporter receptor subunit TctC
MRTRIALVVALLGVVVTLPQANAQTYPSRPVRIVVA